MGLDTFARDEHGELPEDAAAAFASAGINLCGGMFSSNGDGGSFRGKVYSDLVESATGISLYHEKIDSDTVSAMYDSIRIAVEGLIELEKFFKVCDEFGLELNGWW